MNQGNHIRLFVMPGCSVCPTMERLFESMHREGVVEGLKIVDVTEHPDLVKQYHIRSVPYYLINDVAFSGLRSRAEVDALLSKTGAEIWMDKIRQELSQGQLQDIEQEIRQHASARDAMLRLLADTETELVVRLGLTAIIETLAHSGLFTVYEQRFIALVESGDERIALDALYYLHLLATPACLQALERVALTGKPSLRGEADELLAESIANQAGD